METVKIVFDVDSKDIKSTTDELKALNKVTNDEVAAMERLSASATDAGDGFVSLRTQVRQAKEEAQKAAEKYGEFSKEANAARVKAGALADQMGDLNRQVNLLNPEAKAKAFSNLAQGVVGAFSIATGALQAFGVKNKEVEALAMKLQGALNITQGIASIGQLKESFTDLQIILGFTTATQKGLTAAQKEQALASAAAALGTTELTAAQQAEAIAAAEAAAANRALNTTFLTNPVFLVIAAIAGLAAAMIALSNDTDSAKNSQIDFTAENDKLKKSLDASKESADGAARAMIDLKVAKGEMSAADAAIAKNNMDLAKSTEEVKNAITSSTGTINAYRKSLIDAKKQYDKDIADAEKNARLSGSAFADRQLAQDKRIAKERYDNLVKDTQARIKKEQEILKANQDNLANLTQETEAKNTTAVIDEGKKRTSARNTEAEQAKAIAEKAWQDEYALIKLRQQNQVDDAKTNEEKLALQQQFAVENYQYELKHLQQSGATVVQLQTLWENYYKTRTGLVAQQDKAVQDSCEKQLKAEKDFIDKMNAISAKQQSPVEQIQAENDAIDQAYAEQYAMAVANGDDTTKINEAYAKAVEAQQKKLTKVLMDEDEKRKESAEKTAMARYNREKEAMDRTLQATNELMNAMASIQAARYNQENIDLQKQKEKGLISEEEYQKKLKEIKHRQDVADKNAAIFKATLDFASAMINALKAPPLAVPAQLAFTAAIAGLNLAKIIATPLPKYQKGTLSVPGIDMGKDSVHALLQPGEAVIPTATNKAYHPTIRAIYEKKISPSEINNFVMSRTKAGSMSTNMTASVDTYALGRVLSKNKGVQIENANLVGKAIARELGNRFNARQSL